MVQGDFKYQERKNQVPRKLQEPITNNPKNLMINNQKPQFDLIDRTTLFSKNIINLCKAIEQNIISKPLISQLIRSGTSIGANYSEANEACSRKDFINKIYIAKKEAKETKYWLNLTSHTCPEHKSLIDPLLKETQELLLILSAIINKSKLSFGP